MARGKNAKQNNFTYPLEVRYFINSLPCKNQYLYICVTGEKKDSLNCLNNMVIVNAMWEMQTYISSLCPVQTSDLKTCFSCVS